MFVVSGFAQVADHVVRIDVDCHSDNENHGADDESRVEEPFGGVVAIGCLGRHKSRNTEHPSGDEEGVQGVENHTHSHNRNRCCALAFHKQREDERPLEIVQQKQPGHKIEHSSAVSVHDACQSHTFSRSFKGIYQGII